MTQEKIRVVPHGAPARLIARAARVHEKRRSPASDVGGGFHLSTFGLLSEGKGIETVIDALPAIIERHPETVYTIAGRTHPDVERREGERYRLMLERRAFELGLGTHVVFDDRFLSVDELAVLLARTDVFLTPYASREQIASGALTFALAAGCAVVSTPYWYAKDMLDSGAGLLVPFGDSDAFAAAICSYLDHPWRLEAARAEALRVGSTLGWPAVAEATASVLEEASALAPRRRPAGIGDLHLPSLRTDHLRTLVDDVGIVQHAHGIIPNRNSGYCVDDVARLAVVSLALAERGDEQIWTASLYRSIAFLHAAAGPGGMRNFMTYDRRWVDEPHIGDHVGRSIWALGDILATAWIPAAVRPTSDLLGSLVASLPDDVPLRTAAYAVLGLSRVDADRLAPTAQRLLERLVEQLGDALERNASDDWCWFEDRLTYDNARLSQALLSGANALGRADLAERGLDSLRWLGDECGLDAGELRLPGHLGRRKDEPAPGGGDEQPLDAAALVEAELTAFALTRSAEHGRRAITAFEWFLGRNRLQKPLYDFATGGCSDGLGSDVDQRQRRRRIHARVPPGRASAGCSRSSRRKRQALGPSRCSYEHARAIRAPPQQPDPHRSALAVSGERGLQPRGRGGGRRRPCFSRASRTAEAFPTSASRARPTASTAGRSTPSRCSHRTEKTRASNGDSRIHVSSGWTSSSAG